MLWGHVVPTGEIGNINLLSEILKEEPTWDIRRTGGGEILRWILQINDIRVFVWIKVTGDI